MTRCGSHTTDHTGYPDDFSLNGIPVAVENGLAVIPAPGAVLLGGIGRKSKVSGTFLAIFLLTMFENML
jgi:hypothetical protein